MIAPPLSMRLVKSRLQPSGFPQKKKISVLPYLQVVIPLTHIELPIDLNGPRPKPSMRWPQG